MKEELLFCPLGGSGEIGMNMNLFAYGKPENQKWIIVDIGVTFTDDSYPGIDLIYPDPGFIIEKKNDLLGIVLTHGHEDHIGAVAYLYDRLECPLYASEFTAEILRLKLNENGFKHVHINILDPREDVKIGNFTIMPLPVAHSIPNSMSIFVQTAYGNVLHSGDWNLDPDPVIGNQTDPKDFKALKDKGVLAYIGDSTNSEFDWSVRKYKFGKFRCESAVN